MADHNYLGRWGENIARELLISKGYAILDSNWRSGHYEIDVIAQRGNRVVFAEVKTRKEGSPDGLLAFDTRKQRQKRGFACSVLGYQTHSLPLCHRKADVFKQPEGTKRLCQVLYVKKWYFCHDSILNPTIPC